MSESTSNSPKTSNTMLTIILVIIGIVLLALVVYLLSPGLRVSLDSPSAPTIPASDVEAQPSISILAVNPDVDVRIDATNFPRDTELEVRIGKAGSEVKNGVLVGTFISGDGSFLATFNIPAEQHGEP